jgi:hypothetical protein
LETRRVPLRDAAAKANLAAGGDDPMTVHDDAAGAPGAGRYKSFAEFYPFYIREHANRTSRRLHVVGTGLSIALALAAVSRLDWRLGLAAVVCGYAFAWVGHFFFEKNRPATFTYPLWSLRGDFKLFFETVTLKRRF